MGFLRKLFLVWRFLDVFTFAAILLHSEIYSCILSKKRVFVCFAMLFLSLFLNENRIRTSTEALHGCAQNKDTFNSVTI